MSATWAFSAVASRGSVLVGERRESGQRLAVVVERDAFVQSTVEEVVVRRLAHLIGTEVVGTATPGVVLRPVLDDVVGDGARRRPVVAVDRGLGVGVDVIEQREAPHEGVHVGREVLAEQGQIGVAVATRIVAEHLVVGAVLPHDVEDVLDRAAGSDRRPGRRRLGVGGDDLPIGVGGEPADAAVAGEVQDAGVAAHDRGQVLEAVDEVVAVERGPRVGAVRVWPNAEAASGYPDELALRVGRRHGRVGAEREPTDQLERGCGGGCDPLPWPGEPQRSASDSAKTATASSPESADSRSQPSGVTLSSLG